MVHVQSSDSSKRHANSNNFLIAITAALTLLAKRASRLARNKPKFASSKMAAKDVDDDDGGRWKIELRTPPPKSPLATPKKLFSNISSKALLPFHHKKKKKAEEEEEWGDGGVWQKEILMGGKCEPVDFSGAIFYDINGNRLSEVPFKSPRASPLPGYLTRARQQHAL